MNPRFHTIALSVITALHCTGAPLAGSEGWTGDFAAAKKEAKSSNKDILIDFTGSDWCGWCIKLHKEVFEHDSFKTGVKDKFVLVELDYPSDKSKHSESIRKQNEEIKETFAIRGFPTVLLCDSDGRPYASTGYKAGGAAKYVLHLDELREGKAKRDAAFAAAAKAEGKEKATRLIAALTNMGITKGSIASAYGDIASQIKEADPNDETGYAKTSEAESKKIAFQNELNRLTSRQDLDGAIQLLDKNIARQDGNAEKMQLTMSKVMIYLQHKKYDEALKAVDEAKVIAGESKTSDGLDGYKRRIEAMKKTDAVETEKSGH